MWHWIRDHKRKALLESPFPIAWEEILNTNVAHYRRLKSDERDEFHDLLRVFIAEKHWEGCGGLELNDEIRVTIAALACLMIFALPHDVYEGVESIFVYPSTVVIPERKPGVFEIANSPLSGPVPISGQAFLRGPIVLVWDSIKNAARHPEAGHNVVYHEFAHKLDMLDGRADGTPPLADRERYLEWVQVCSKAFLRLRADDENGIVTLVDSYGATNEAEFFAVITELFFDRPAAMKEGAPELYAVLSGFYHQDPAVRDQESAHPTGAF